MRGLRTVIATILTASLIGVSLGFCQAEATPSESCCAAPCHSHSGRHGVPTSSACADRCGSPAISTQGVCVPARPQFFIALPPTTPLVAAIAEGRFVCVKGDPAAYESPPPGRLTGRSPPAC